MKLIRHLHTYHTFLIDTAIPSYVKDALLHSPLYVVDVNYYPDSTEIVVLDSFLHSSTQVAEEAVDYMNRIWIPVTDLQAELAIMRSDYARRMAGNGGAK